MIKIIFNYLTSSLMFSKDLKCINDVTDIILKLKLVTLILKSFI